MRVMGKFKLKTKTNKMKTLFLFLIFGLVIFSCSQKENYPLTKKTIITGQISNFLEVSDRTIVSIILKDILTEQRIITKNVNDKGQFRFEFELDHPTDFVLKYSSSLTYFISPGDSINFDIDNGCWKSKSNTNADQYSYYKVSGTAKRINKEVSKFSALYNDKMFNYTMQETIDSIKGLEPLQFLKYKQKQLNKFYAVLDSFNNAENTSVQFQNWAKNYLKYSNWYDLMYYRYGRPLATGDANPFTYVHEMPKEYFNFLNNMENKRSDALQASSYNSFLMEYEVYNHQMIPLETRKKFRELFEKDSEKGFSYYLKHYPVIESGFIKDVLLSKFYYTNLDAKLYNQINNLIDTTLIKDEQLRNRIQEKFNYEKKLSENPEFAAGSKINELINENDFYQALIKKYPNKVMYLDFWAPWCGPCLGEMPDSKTLKNQFEGKEVVFIYLANRCEESAWKTTIAENKIEGEHYFLTDKQYAGLRDLFEIKGIPHYALIDKSGKVVNAKAPRPSSGKEIINLINEYLK